MLKRFLLVLVLLSLAVSSFCTTVEDYPPMSNTEIVENFIAVFEELEMAYQSYQALYRAVASLPPKLDEMSQMLSTAARISATTAADVMRIETELQNSEQAADKKIRDLTVQVYLISAVGILASLLIAILT